jgi:hypothetical protein
MLAHDMPLIGIERAGFEQDAIRDAHFANIVEQRPTANMFKRWPGDPKAAGEADRHLRHAARVPFGLVIAQIERP